MRIQQYEMPSISACINHGMALYCAHSIISIVVGSSNNNTSSRGNISGVLCTYSTPAYHYEQFINTAAPWNSTNSTIWPRIDYFFMHMYILFIAGQKPYKSYWWKGERREKWGEEKRRAFLGICWVHKSHWKPTRTTPLPELRLQDLHYTCLEKLREKMQPNLAKFAMWSSSREISGVTMTVALQSTSAAALRSERRPTTTGSTTLFNKS